MEGEVDPNAVTQEARSGEQKASFYLTKAECKKKKKMQNRQNGMKGKVAKQNQQDKVQTK